MLLDSKIPNPQNLPLRPDSEDIQNKLKYGDYELIEDRRFEKGTLFLEKTQYLKAPYIRLFTGLYYNELLTLQQNSIIILLYIMKNHLLPYNYCLISQKIYSDELKISRSTFYRGLQELESRKILIKASSLFDFIPEDNYSTLYNTIMKNIGNNYRYTNKSQWYYVSHNLLWVGGIQFLLDLPKYEAGINVDIKNRTKPYWNLLDRYGRPTIEDSLHDRLLYGKYLQQKLHALKLKINT